MVYKSINYINDSKKQNKKSGTICPGFTNLENNMCHDYNNR